MPPVKANRSLVIFFTSLLMFFTFLLSSFMFSKASGVLSKAERLSLCRRVADSPFFSPLEAEKLHLLWKRYRCSDVAPSSLLASPAGSDRTHDTAHGHKSGPTHEHSQAKFTDETQGAPNAGNDEHRGQHAGVHIDVAVRDHTETKLEVIAVLSATTTRKEKEPIQLEKLALFAIFMPSFVRTAQEGFVYRVTVGHDHGDKFYDAPGVAARVGRWFEENVRVPLTARNITAELELVGLDNPEKKPGPAFNAIAKVAYDHGADYFFRVNDDTEFTAPWAKLFVARLRSWGPPFGAVGPAESNARILTHDFTHRTHMEIFDGLYYPAVLSDWWMDDWISFVYGTRRTSLMNLRVIHHVRHHGQNYQVDHSHEYSLMPEIDKGRKKILQWMKDHKLSDDVIQRFETDSFQKREFGKTGAVEPVPRGTALWACHGLMERYNITDYRRLPDRIQEYENEAIKQAWGGYDCSTILEPQEPVPKQ